MWERRKAEQKEAYAVPSRVFKYTDDRYRLALVGPVVLFLLFSAICVAIFTNAGARPKNISDAIPVLVIAVSPIPLFLLAWWPARPIQIDADGVSSLFLDRKLRSIKWSSISKIERVSYISNRTKSRKTIIKLYSGDCSISIYDFIDDFWSVKQCLRDVTAAMDFPKFDVDRTKAGLTVPNGSILDG
jgi:hypothetical protein